MRKVLWFILGAFLFCAIGQFLCGAEPTEMIELTGVQFPGSSTKLLVPAECGDFSLTHEVGLPIFRVPKQNYTSVSWIPKGKGVIFQTHAKLKCPQMVALESYDVRSEVGIYWIYSANGQQAYEVSLEKFEEHMKQIFVCGEDI